MRLFLKILVAELNIWTPGATTTVSRQDPRIHVKMNGKYWADNKDTFA